MEKKKKRVLAISDFVSSSCFSNRFFAAGGPDCDS